MKAWILGDPDELTLSEKPVPMPGRAEVLVRIDAVAICATDLEIIHHGSPALVRGGPPFNEDFTPCHQDMGSVAALGPGVDEYRIGEGSRSWSKQGKRGRATADRMIWPPGHDLFKVEMCRSLAGGARFLQYAQTSERNASS